MITKDRGLKLKRVHGCMIGLSQLLPVLPAFHTAEPQKTTSPPLYHRAGMPQSEENGENKRGKEMKRKKSGRSERKTGGVRESRVVAAGCSEDKQPA